MTSHLPIGAGLGSSAAFSSSLAAALMIWHGHAEESSLSDSTVRADFTAKVNSWAFRAEKLIHGNPSGIDNCVATYGTSATATTTHLSSPPPLNRVFVPHFEGGAIGYVGGNMQNLQSFPPLQFLLTNTKVPRNTMDLVAGVRARKEKFPIVVDPLLESIHGISEKFTSILGSICKPPPGIIFPPLFLVLADFSLPLTSWDRS